MEFNGFTLMTLNLQAFEQSHGIWTQRRRRIAAAIESHHVDAVALRAVGRGSEENNQCRELVDLLGQKFYSYCVPMNEKFGLGFIFRVPAVAFETVKFSASGHEDDPSERSLLIGTFETAVGTIRIANANFSWVEEVAVSNVKESLKHFRGTEFPEILAGDLNQEPGSEALRLLAEADYEDCYELAGRHPDGFTFEADEPTKRIDHIFANEKMADRVVSLEIIDGRSTDEHLSNHLAVVGRFE